MKLNWLRLLALLSSSNKSKIKPKPSGWELVEILRNETKELLGGLYYECMLDEECFNEMIEMEREIPLSPDKYYYKGIA